MNGFETNDTPTSNKAEVVRTFNLLIGKGNVAELRALNASTKSDRWPHTATGYFDNGEAMAEAVASITSATGIYTTFNPVDPALLARSCNKLRKAQRGESTGDGYITRRRWLMIDCDAQRPSGISATDAEREGALDRSRKVYSYLRERGWPEPVACDSGNGAHLYYRIDLPAEDGGLIQRCLMSLSLSFDDENVTIDTGVYNPARITKIFGTVACKGDDIPQRPHRMAKILRAPDALEVVPRELLEELAARAMPEEAAPAPSTYKGNGQPYDVEAFISRNNLDVDGPNSFQGKLGAGKSWTFRTSPMCEHDDDGPHLEQHATGAISAGCHHNSCSWKWQELRAKFAQTQPGGGPRSVKENLPKQKGTGLAPRFNTTDLGNGERFAAQHGNAVRYCHTWNKWLIWDGRR